MKTVNLILSFLGIMILLSCKPTVYQAGNNPSAFYGEEPVIKVSGKVSGTRDELFRKAVDWAETHFIDRRCMFNTFQEKGQITGSYLLHYNDVSPHSEYYSRVSIRVDNELVEMWMSPVDSWKIKCFFNCDDFYSEEQAMSDMNSLCNEFLSDIKGN